MCVFLMFYVFTVTVSDQHFKLAITSKMLSGCELKPGDASRPPKEEQGTYQLTAWSLICSLLLL